VNILGVPNSGKSTLLNKLVGKKVSIVSHKVQTTRFCIKGLSISTLEDDTRSQIIFIDTPGIFDAKRRLDKAMVSAAWSELKYTDKVLFIHDVSKDRLNQSSIEIIKGILNIHSKVILVLNKIDLLLKDKLLERISEIEKLFEFEKIFLISAKNGSGCKDLKSYLANTMPIHPFMYDENTTSDLPHSLLASEITREKLFNLLNKELPYNLMVETEKWTVNKDNSIRIEQTIYVNKDSHKPIILGKSGNNIKRVGSLARQELQELLNCKIHLFLFVKFKKNWMDDPSKYSSIGLDYNA
jgi:GTPase